MNSFGVASFAVGMLASAAMAQSPLCTELRSTEVPFVITYEVKTSAPGKLDAAPLRQEQKQVFRKGRDTIVYTFDPATPAVFLRSRGANVLLPAEYFYSTHPQPRTWAYSADLAVDYVARRQPLEVSGRLTGADGQLFLDALMRVDFTGTGAADVGGCRFDTVGLIQTLSGTAGREPIASTMDIWLSPELRVPLQHRLVLPDLEVTYTPVAISKDFKRVE